MLGQIQYLGEGLLTWTILGAFVGYMMGFFREELDEGKSVLGDMAMGILAAVLCGFGVHYFIAGRPGFLLSVAAAAIAAIGLTAWWGSAGRHHHQRRTY